MGMRATSLLSVVSLAAAAAILGVNGGCSSGDAFIGTEASDGAAGSSSGSGTSGSGSSSSATTSSGSTGSSSGQGDAGPCCPAGWDLHTCTFADGGSGLACHNPALGCASSTTCGLGCDEVVAGRCSDGGATGLQWWMTCGEPVCQAPGDGGALRDDAGAPCPAVGTACSSDGDTCGTRSPAVACGAIEQCSATDPTGGNCPISSRTFKENIRYVGDAELEMFHDEALHIRLASYNYKPQFEDPRPRHLGFIVEDDPTSPAVDRNHDRVDMYGYVSMIVAAMQVQEKEIATLRSELDAARSQACIRDQRTR
jgi:hypothetical protein